jgi:hypothetical protein
LRRRVGHLYGLAHNVAFDDVLIAGEDLLGGKISGRVMQGGVCEDGLEVIRNLRLLEDTKEGWGISAYLTERVVVLDQSVNRLDSKEAVVNLWYSRLAVLLVVGVQDVRSHNGGKVVNIHLASGLLIDF